MKARKKLRAPNAFASSEATWLFACFLAAALALSAVGEIARTGHAQGLGKDAAPRRLSKLDSRAATSAADQTGSVPEVDKEGLTQRLIDLESSIESLKQQRAAEPHDQKIAEQLSEAETEYDSVSAEMGGDRAPHRADTDQKKRQSSRTPLVHPPPAAGCTATVTTFTNNTPTAIPTGPAVVSSQIVVSGVDTFLNDVDLTTTLTHTFAADLDITIQSPAGTVVTLTTDNGAGNDNVFNGTVWDDDANPAGQVPYTTNSGLVTDHPYVNLVLASPLVPEETFGAFIGENPNGTWTITISDDLAGDGGSLDSWSLELQTLAAAPVFANRTVTNSTPVAIPTGPAVVSSTIVVAGAGAFLSDVDVATTITHTFAADLDITIQSPAGTVVTLTTDNGAGNDNVFFATVWDDDANPAGQVPYTSNNGLATDHAYVNLMLASPLAPEEALAAFIGEDPNGTWTITISDDLAGDGGSLDLWTLGLQTAICGTPATAGQIIISEFRVRGPNGANDEFIELYNASGADHTVAAASGTGYGVAASDGTTRCSIPNGTVIPNRGHFLCVNSVGYSLASYPAGNGTTATGDATYTTDIPDNAGIALFNNNTGGGSYVLANRLDAVGSTSEANTLYKEGTGYPALTPFSIDYSFYRDNCGKGGSITTFGPCPSGGLPVDTDNNAANFVFVDTNGTSAGAGQRLGSPGPENLASPINRTNVFTAHLLDATVAAASPPNRVRDFTSDPANNSTFGTLSIRRRFVNNTGANVTRLRFRVIDQTTFPAPSGIADLRTRTSSLVVVAGVNDAATCAATGVPATPPCTVNVQGTTLEQPPSQPNGGAFNGSYSAGTVTLGTPLANGASINLLFLMGIQQTGSFKFFVNIEALP